MVSAPSRSTLESEQATRLAERIKRHKEEVARLREKYGDPEEALNLFIRERFVLEALVPDEQSDQDITSWALEAWEDDDPDAR